jgi:hypothetical protein
MADKLSCKELISTLTGLKIRSMVRTDQGRIVEAEGSNYAICSDCDVSCIPTVVVTGVRFETSPSRECPLPLRLSFADDAAAVTNVCARFLSSASQGSCWPHAQQTERLNEIHGLPGHALGGRCGQRFLHRLGTPYRFGGKCNSSGCMV